MFLNLSISTPDKAVFSGLVSSVELPGSHGRFVVLAHHAPLITRLKAGVLRYRTQDKMEQLSVTEGVAEVLNNTVKVLLDR